MSEYLIAASYYAPRGAGRLLNLGSQISMRYLTPADKLIGIIGEHGVGKSLLIRGIFPGLELTNDDDGVKVRPLPLKQVLEDSYYNAHTYHIDVRFEMAFMQIGDIVELVRTALKKEKRIIVEHFELIYGMLGMNADLLIGIGEEIIITRPSMLGPYPQDIFDSIKGTALYRRMAHSAEDITSFILEKEYGFEAPDIHSDFPRGFVMEFTKKPPFKIKELENKVKDIIEQRVDIGKLDEKHIKVGDFTIDCTGVHIHVGNSGDIENYRLLKKEYIDPMTGKYKLIGLVGNEPPRSYTYMLPLDTKLFEE